MTTLQPKNRNRTDVATLVTNNKEGRNKEVMEERRGVSSPMQELRMFGKATTILFPHLVCWKSGWKYSKCKRDWVLSAPLAKSVYGNAQQQRSNRSKIKFPWYKNYSDKREKNIFDLCNLFSVFIERFANFTFPISVNLKNLMGFYFTTSVDSVEIRSSY